MKSLIIVLIILGVLVYLFSGIAPRGAMVQSGCSIQGEQLVCPIAHHEGNDLEHKIDIKDYNYVITSQDGFKYNKCEYTGSFISNSIAGYCTIGKVTWSGSAVGTAVWLGVTPPQYACVDLNVVQECSPSRITGTVTFYYEGPTTPPSTCGNGMCDAGEDSTNCLSDCPLPGPGPTPPPVNLLDLIVSWIRGFFCTYLHVLC